VYCIIMGKRYIWLGGDGVNGCYINRWLKNNIISLSRKYNLLKKNSLWYIVFIIHYKKYVLTQNVSNIVSYVVNDNNDGNNIIINIIVSYCSCGISRELQYWRINENPWRYIRITASTRHTRTICIVFAVIIILLDCNAFGGIFGDGEKRD